MRSRGRPRAVPRRTSSPAGSTDRSGPRPDAGRAQAQAVAHERPGDAILLHGGEERLQLELGHGDEGRATPQDRKSTRLNSSHLVISYAVFCLKKKKTHHLRLRAVHLRADGQVTDVLDVADALYEEHGE